MSPILFLATIRALMNYPKEYKQILKGFFLISINSLFLIHNYKKAFVHRDISIENVLIGSDKTKSLIDFELASYMHPMWEVVNAIVGFRRKEGFIENFSKSETMQNILNDSKSKKIYKLFSVYSGIHLLSQISSNEERVIANKKYLKYALSI
mgnify:FL=1